MTNRAKIKDQTSADGTFFISPSQLPKQSISVPLSSKSMTVFDSLLSGTGSETVYSWPKFLYSKKFWTWVNLPFMHRGQPF